MGIFNSPFLLSIHIETYEWNAMVSRPCFKTIQSGGRRVRQRWNRIGQELKIIHVWWDHGVHYTLLSTLVCVCKIFHTKICQRKKKNKRREIVAGILKLEIPFSPQRTAVTSPQLFQICPLIRSLWAPVLKRSPPWKASSCAKKNHIPLSPCLMRILTVNGICMAHLIPAVLSIMSPGSVR